MKQFDDIAAWRVFRQQDDFLKKQMGFVPTMGNLHDGHVSLLKRARNENDIVVLSIFVNPTQFNDSNDLSQYPRTLVADRDIAEREKVDYLLVPTFEAMYPDQYQYRIQENTISQQLCGLFRPGHFEGMLTVVMKLLQLVKPTNLYMGEKDYQQAILVKKMCEAFFLDTNIVFCETIRDEDGVALSSRNQRLSVEQRKKAAVFARLLSEISDLSVLEKRLSETGLTVEYLETWMSRRLAAIRMGDIRLIDNYPHSDNTTFK